MNNSFGQKPSQLNLVEGKITLNGVPQRQQDLKRLVYEQNNQELWQIFRDYQRTKFSRMTIARLRDFGLFFGVMDVAPPYSIQPVPLGVGIVSAGGVLLLRKPTKRRLRSFVDAYNDTALVNCLKANGTKQN